MAYGNHKKASRKNPLAFLFKNPLKTGLYIVIGLFVIGIITRLGDFIRAFGQGGALSGLLNLFGIDTPGNEKQRLKGWDEIDRLIKNKELNLKPRHYEYANIFHDLLGESSVIRGFFTKKVTQKRTNEIAKQFDKINRTLVTPVGDGSGVDPENTTNGYLLLNEYACIYAAYHVREVQNREVPLVALFVQTTKGTLSEHLQRYLQDKYFMQGYQFASSTLVDWFLKNDYLANE